MEETESGSVCEDIECELERLVKKMEVKGEQISKLMRHQDNVRRLWSEDTASGLSVVALCDLPTEVWMHGPLGRR